MYVMKKNEFMYTKKILPEGWKKKVLAAVFLAVLGNILVQYVIPWPEFMTVSYEAAAEELAAYPLGVYLALTLLIAPLLEEGIFRKGLYGILRKWFGVILSAFISAAAFGLYHGNWIQGIYGFVFGLLLSWGYESSSFEKYRMAVVMHGAANGAALLLNVVLIRYL